MTKVALTLTINGQRHDVDNRFVFEIRAIGQRQRKVGDQAEHQVDAYDCAQRKTGGDERRREHDAAGYGEFSTGKRSFAFLGVFTVRCQIEKIVDDVGARSES